MWVVFQSAVCTALGGKTPVTPGRPEDLAGPDHAECPANVLVNKRGDKKTKSVTIPNEPQEHCLLQWQ